MPKRPTQTIFDLGPKERFNMIREVHHVHQKSWKKNSKKMAKRNHSKRSACSLAPSSRHYLPAYAKQEISQSIYNIIVPCIVFSCYIIPKVIQEMFQGQNYSLNHWTSNPFDSHLDKIFCWIRLYFSRPWNWAYIEITFQRSMSFHCLWLKKNSRLTKMLSIT